MFFNALLLVILFIVTLFDCALDEEQPSLLMLLSLSCCLQDNTIRLCLELRAPPVSVVPPDDVLLVVVAGLFLCFFEMVSAVGDVVDDCKVSLIDGVCICRLRRFIILVGVRNAFGLL